MAYQVLARKWRPQTFAEVVGQEHLARTLKNAIVHNRIGHAYLFVGSRGIGKTTTARIFAKALNCRNNIDGEPCCQCDNCLEVAQGNSLDVIEIDGASHNKVEDIRDIRDNVQYTPVKGKYKIYIIDEVHMLTTAAWNALLKTLEEPPEHVKFLFATTEPHKVLPTIVSRCQRFDLRRIPVPLIVQRLKLICEGEKIFVDDAALAAIARAADGGMRDAQSILDQMIAFCGGLTENERITEQDVISVFGLASGMELRETAAAIFANDLDKAFGILRMLADGGRDLERFYEDLVGFIRNLMIAATCRDASKFIEVSESELAELVQMGRSLPLNKIQQALQLLVAQEWTMRTALNKRIYLEVALAKVVTDLHSVQLDDIMTQLNILNGSLPPTAMPSPSFQRPQSNFNSAPYGQAVTAQPATPERTSVQPSAAASAPVSPRQPAAAVPEPVRPAAPVAERPAASAAASVPSQACIGHPCVARDETAVLPGGQAQEPEPPDEEMECEEPPKEMQENASSAEGAFQRLLDELQRAYPEATELFRVLSNTQAASFEQGVLTLTYDAAEMGVREVRCLSDERNRALLQKAFGTFCRRGTIEFRGIGSAETQEGEGAKGGLRHTTGAEREALAARLPFIQKFNQLFKTSVVDARIKE